MNISRYKNLYLGLALVLAIVSVGAIARYGFHLGIDFTGGALWEVSVDAPADRVSAAVSSVTGSQRMQRPATTSYAWVRLHLKRMTRYVRR
jgi:preprotein translocase subunit SecF